MVLLQHGCGMNRSCVPTSNSATRAWQCSLPVCKIYHSILSSTRMPCTAARWPRDIVNGCGFCSYNGARTSDQFLDFLKKQLEADKGFARVEELDKLIKDFVGADKKVCRCSSLQWQQHMW